MADRDDSNLKQFNSRAKQPKLLSSGPANQSPVNVYIIYDQGFGSLSNEVEGVKYKYVGVSNAQTQYESMTAKKTGFMSSNSLFNW